MNQEKMKITNEPMPIMHMIPAELFVPPKEDYESPMYKTPTRAGTLSTTGHSTNFVCAVNLPTDEDTNNWIIRSSALICQTPE